VNRRLWGNLTWLSSFSGNHRGLTQQEGNSSHSEGYSTSLSSRRWSINGIYSKSTGLSVLGSNGIVVVVPTPGVVNSILFNGVSYGGGGSVSPFRRLSISGTLSRAISDTVATTYSRNDTEIINAQLQYQLRRIGLRAGYTRYTQGISAIGLPANTTSYFVGVSRWFDFF
jgi:hypothetical protein